MSKSKKPRKGGPPTNGFVTEYVNRAGRLMRASDYGYKAWPFGPRKRKG
jgi:hypothetical protein